MKDFHVQVFICSDDVIGVRKVCNCKCEADQMYSGIFNFEQI
jgi:hypothetical protein